MNDNDICDEKSEIRFWIRVLPGTVQINFPYFNLF